MSELLNSFALNENWFIDKDEKNEGIERGFNKMISCTATPCSIPSIIQEFLPGYHGVAFYWCKFTPDINLNDKKYAVLRFEAIDYKADVYLNGEYIGSHEGGETPFSFDVTDTVKIGKENLLSVRVVNPILDDIDGLNIVNVPNRNKAPRNMAGSCTNHGGLWGEVTLLSLPNINIDDVFLIGDIHTGKLTAKVEINNKLNSDVPVLLTMNVYTTAPHGHKVVGEIASFRSEGEKIGEEISLTVPDLKLWDIDDPNLYNVEVSVRTEFGRHRKIISFGFREFKVVDGYFMLNGRKVFVKSSHTGNAFPVGQGYPAIKEQIRKDMIMAKSYGFNTVRSIAGMLREEQLKVCDEIGLMVYEENFAAWNLGFGFYVANGNDYIGDEKKMLERFDYCTSEMVKRDRNHPSITMWGLLNEMGDHFAVTRHARDFLPKLREYDETRLVLFNSGKWDNYLDTASASNPYTNVWGAVMGADLIGFINNENKHPDNIGSDNCGDLHIYPRYPLSDDFINYVRNYSKDYKPAFFSESGMSSIFNVIEEAKHYEQYGYRADLDDYLWIKSQADKLEKDWQRLGLTKIYPYAEMMLKESQRISADDRMRIFNAVRSNPKFNGYSLTGLLDHGWCGEGLWSLWRRFKPEVYDTVCDGWAPLRFCLFTKSHVYSGEEFEIEAVLANECVLKEGKYKAHFAIVGPEGTVEAFSEDFEITDDAFAVPVMKKKIKLLVPTGKYSLIAYMDDASPLGNKYDFFVTDRNDIVKSDAKVKVIGLSDAAINFLNEICFEVNEYKGEEEGLILAGANLSADEIKSLKSAASNGAKVFFVNPLAFYGKEDCINALSMPEIKFSEQWNWLYHKENVMANRAIFKNLGFGLIDQKIFGSVITKYSFETEITPTDPACPAFYTGYHGFEGSYGLVHNMLGIKCGEGLIYLNSFDIENNLNKIPAADKLLYNIVNALK